MAENSFMDQLLMLQQLQAVEDAKRRRQQQATAQQGGGGMSPGQMNQGYNMYQNFAGTGSGGTGGAAASSGGWGNGSWLGSLAGGGESAGASGTLSTSAGPYAALAAALGAFKLNSDWMSEGSGKSWGGEMEEAWSESFGDNGIWGMLKGLF